MASVHQVDDIRKTRQRTAVVYVTDAGYLFPSLVSAEQVQRQVADIADVFVALVGFPDAELPRVEEVITSLRLKAMRMNEFHLPENITWLPTYLPPATLGRLQLPSYLPQTYRNVVYIDGDTQVIGDICPLLELDVPLGLVAAAPDRGWLSEFRGVFSPWYLALLGVPDASRYLNSGVLAMSRETLDKVMPASLDFFISNSDVCRFADQSAINAVMRGNFFQLSPRYNFAPEYYRLGIDRVFDPVIVHFSGSLKPWKLSGWPLGERFADSYTSMLARHPHLERYADPVTAYVPPAPKREATLLRRAYHAPLLRPLRAFRDGQRAASDIRRLPEFALN
jgi:lipopolysaccharide biosynthesis glycosyltransferase